MKKIVYIAIIFLFIGFSGGIIVGVKIDDSQVFNTTIEKIKQKRGGRDIIIDIEQPVPEKSKKELRKEKRKIRRDDNDS